MTDNSGLIASALELTNAELYTSIDGANSWLSAIQTRGKRVRIYRDYERGDHRANITTQMKKMLRITEDGSKLNDFNINYMRAIIDKMAGRVAVSSLTTGDDNIDKNWLSLMLKRQDFQASQGMWWRGAIRDGDAFVLVDPATGLWSNEPAFDGYSGMVAIYNSLTRRPIWGCKIWSESDFSDRTATEETDTSGGGGSPRIMRLIVYQQSGITYWTGEEGGDEVRQDSGNPASGWPTEMGQSLPFVSFANQRDSYTSYGDSELRPAIPQQDALNRTFHSMIMASEFAAFKIIWSIGLEIDPAGITPGAVINLLLNSSSGDSLSEMNEAQIEFLKAVRVGQFEATDIGQYINQIKAIVQEISQTTQTPIYGVTAQGNLSGEALKQLEIGLISKIERFKAQNTDALVELIELTAKVERIFNPADLPYSVPGEFRTVNVSWKPAELRDNDVLIQNLYTMREKTGNLWSDDFYRARIGALMGMNKDEIAKEAEQAQQQEQDHLDRLTDIQNNRGGNNGQNQENDDAAGNQ